MFLTKDGVTFEVTQPNEIARLKRAGYKEEKPVEVKPVEPVAPVAPETPVEVKPEGKKTTKKDGE